MAGSGRSTGGDSRRSSAQLPQTAESDHGACKARLEFRVALLVASS